MSKKEEIDVLAKSLVYFVHEMWNTNFFVSDFYFQ